MTAGRGIIHSEMPEQQAGRMAGFQLWVNLAAKDKLCPPAYRDIPPAGVPQIELDGGVTVRVVAGASHGVTGAVTRPTTEPLVLDVTLPPGSRFAQAIPDGHNAFFYVHGGEVHVDAEPTLNTPNEVALGQMAILTTEAGADGLRLRVPEGVAEAARVLIVAGRPLNEPIAQYGPFVMNSSAEIHQAVADFQRGALAS
jgi:redox-sensitive bicupin YhaK (pirin superfamily)